MAKSRIFCLYVAGSVSDKLMLLSVLIVSKSAVTFYERISEF